MVCKLSQRLLIIGLGFTGLFLLISGILLGPLVNMEVDQKLKKMMPLVKGTKTYNYWINPPIPIDFQLYFFHVVNPEEIVQNGAKPVLEEKGPYTYRLIDTKENLTHHKNFTVSYNERNVYVFQRHLSVGDENDTFTSLNLPLITATTLVTYEYAFIREMAKLFFDISQDADLFVKHSVKDLLWGYTDPLLATVKQLLHVFDIPFNDRFGFFYQLNNSIANNYTVYTGEDNLDKISQFTQWDGKSKLTFWSSDTCNMINGTDGNIFHPHIKDTDQLYLFYPQICRSYMISFEKKGEFKGVRYSRFIMKDDVFASIKTNPENAGFCTPRNKCLPSGLINNTECRKGTPVIISQPHFLGADQSVIDSFDGIRPNKDLHETYIDLVPLIGNLVRTQRTIQINMFVEKSMYISQTKNINYFYFPVMYIKEKASLTDSLAAQFRDELQNPLLIVFYAKYCCIGIGIVLLLLVAGYCLRIKIKAFKHEKKTESAIFDATVNEHTKLLKNEKN
ncbi:lysosome membrane protein 2-like isoform X1 [Mytilus edulis]|uniref:lysosome membrane protein 2-like isoform X1 n=1 Tax=Mytilus edulis TaxID=6550 RepID=UPI0039EE938A